MKKLILILCLSLSIVAKVNFYNIYDAIELSKKTNKKIMLVIYTDNCPYCHGYFNLIKKNNNLINIINNSVYQVAINKKDAINLGLYGVNSVPSFLFFDKNLNECTSPIEGLPRDINQLINKIKTNCKDIK